MSEGNLDFEHPRDRTVTQINAPQDVVIVFMKNYSRKRFEEKLLGLIQCECPSYHHQCDMMG